MFSNISWFQYLIFVCAVALSWYAAIFYIDYRHDLLQSLQTKKADPIVSEKFNFLREDVPGINLKNSQMSPAISQVIQSFSDEVVAYLEEDSKSKVIKEELLSSIGKIANKYPSLALSEFKESLNQFINIQTESYCAMFLSEEDLNKVWGDT